MIALDGPDLDSFIGTASALLAEMPLPVMLTPGIRAAFAAGVAALDDSAATRRVGVGALFETTARHFIGDRSLGSEVFGTSALVVRCADLAQMAQVIADLEGQLTATLHIDAGDVAAAAPILALLQTRAGRFLANGLPTGVEVTHAMVHGGPYPAASDGRTTSVGTLAMMRFLRPVCYQDLPDSLLPLALQAANPWNIPRRVNGLRVAP